MEKMNYEAPTIELVKFQTEQGFAISSPRIGATIKNYNDGFDY